MTPTLAVRVAEAAAKSAVDGVVSLLGVTARGARTELPPDDAWPSAVLEAVARRAWRHRCGGSPRCGDARREDPSAIPRTGRASGWRRVVPVDHHRTRVNHHSGASRPAEPTASQHRGRPGVIRGSFGFRATGGDPEQRDHTVHSGLRGGLPRHVQPGFGVIRFDDPRCPVSKLPRPRRPSCLGPSRAAAIPASGSRARPRPGMASGDQSLTYARCRRGPLVPLAPPRRQGRYDGGQRVSADVQSGGRTRDPRCPRRTRTRPPPDRPHSLSAGSAPNARVGKRTSQVGQLGTAAGEESRQSTAPPGHVQPAECRQDRGLLGPVTAQYRHDCSGGVEVRVVVRHGRQHPVGPQLDERGHPGLPQRAAPSAKPPRRTYVPHPVIRIAELVAEAPCRSRFDTTAAAAPGTSARRPPGETRQHRIHQW